MISVYRAIQSIPVIGTVIYIANSYAYRGDMNAHNKFAGISLWVKAFFFPLVFSGILSVITLWPMFQCFYITKNLSLAGLNDFLVKPGALITSVMPSLLGFGIGIYALIFALASPLVKQLHEAIEARILTGKKSHGSVLVLNADFAFPLTVLIVATVLGVIQQAFSACVPLVIVSWVGFWYAVIAMIEIVGVIFGLADNSLIDKSQENKNIPSDRSDS